MESESVYVLVFIGFSLHHISSYEYIDATLSDCVINRTCYGMEFNRKFSYSIFFEIFHSIPYLRSPIPIHSILKIFHSIFHTFSILCIIFKKS